MLTKRNFARATLIVSSIYCFSPAEANDYYLADGRAATLSGEELSYELQFGGNLRSMECFRSFMIIESSDVGGKKARHYSIDFSSLARGTLRYLLTAEDQCSFDLENSIDSCSRTRPHSQDIEESRGFVANGDKIFPEVVLYRTISDDEWAEYKVTGRLPFVPVIENLQSAIIGGYAFQFQCEGGADISKFLVDDPSPNDLQELKASYKGRFASFRPEEWKEVIDLIGSE